MSWGIQSSSSSVRLCCRLLFGGVCCSWPAIQSTDIIKRLDLNHNVSPLIHTGSFDRSQQPSRRKVSHFHSFYTHTHAHTHTHTTVYWPFFCSYLDGPVPEVTFTHSHPSWSSDILYQLPPSVVIHSIATVQVTCLTVLFHNLSPGPPWTSSWSQ